MVIGSILLQPKKVPDAAPLTDFALLEDVLTLVVRFIFDRAKGGTMLNELSGALEAALQQILADREASLDQARQHFESFVAPLIAEVQSLGASDAKDDHAAEIFAAGGNLFHLLSNFLQNLTTEKLRGHLDEVFGVLQGDLGLNGAIVDQTVAALFDNVAASVRQVPAGAAPEIRDNRVQTAQLLGRLKRRLQGQFPFPALNADALAGPLLQSMRRANFDSFAATAANIATAVDGGFTACGALLDVAQFSFALGPGGPGAADSPISQSTTKAWYASWLQGDNVRKEEPRSTLTQIAFGPISQDRMDFWSKHSRWSQYALEFLFPMILSAFQDHRALFPFQQGNFANGTLQDLLTLADAIVVPGDDEDVPWWVNLPSAAVFVLVGSFEGRSPFGQFDGLLYGLRLMVKGLRKTWFWHFSRNQRDLFLSVLTLINNRANDPAMPPPGIRVNKNEFVALSVFFTELYTLFLALAIPNAWYSVNFNVSLHPTARLICAYIFGTMGAVVLGFLTGYLVAWPIAGERGQIIARRDWFYFLFPIITFPVYWWFHNEGNTDGGKLGYSYPGGATSVDQANTLTFNGYPDPTGSPYNLPFENGNSVECVQGNHGLFSHNAINTTVQMFAYDFSLPFNTEILCMRSGMVVAGSAIDNIADGTSGGSPSGANQIVIQHTTPDPQDLDVNGAATTTFAVYLHGANGTIPAALKVAGAVVTKGQVIMKVNSTGNSRFNHVHVDVRPLAPGGGPASYTIPFVFNEVDGDGVPRSNRYYESKNTKVG